MLWESPESTEYRGILNKMGNNARAMFLQKAHQATIIIDLAADRWLGG